jgi:uncharacterized membrane protein
MSVAHFTPSMMARGSSRWLLLGSLALNLFFVGIAIAMAVRPAASPSWDRNVFVRVERLAASLPPADGDLVRGQIRTNHAPIEDTQTKYRAAQDAIRATLRNEPFDVAALQAAMAQTRAARQNFDQAIQGVFATSAAQMSPAGRRALADWPPRRNSASSSQ